MSTSFVSQLKEAVSQWSALGKFLKAPSSSIGLDIGSTSVKGVKLKKSTGNLTLLKAAVEVLPPHPDSSQKSQAIQKVLERLNGDGQGGTLVTAVAGAGTVLRSVMIPKMTPEELKTALSFEAEKHIPFKLEESLIDSFIVGDRPGGRMEVWLAAAKREVVSEHLELLKLTGLIPVVVDLEMSALANAWEATHPGSEKPMVLIHMGARGAILDFLAGGKLEFTREIPFGGDFFTEGLSRSLQSDLSQAEQVKCDPKERDTEIRTLLQPLWEEWLKACRTSFDFYENQFGHGVEGLFFSGGSARLSGFLEWVQSATGLVAEVWNPLEGLQVGPEPVSKELGPTLAVAVGLSVRGLA